MAKAPSKLRIYDIAKEYSLSSDALLTVLRGMGFTIKSHMSVASDDMLEAISEKFKREIAEVKKDDAARQEKLKELEAKKRRQEAEKSALKRKAEALARKKKGLLKKKAHEKAARELAAKKEKEKKVASEKQVDAPKTEKKAAAKIETPEKKRGKETAKEKTPPRKAKIFESVKPKIVSAAPPVSKETGSQGAVGSSDKKGRKKISTKSIAASHATIISSSDAPADVARKFSGKGQTSARPAPGGGRGGPAAGGRGGPVVGGGRPPRKRKRRDKKKARVPKVDTAAIKLSFKQTMATLDGTKKTRKHKKRAPGEEGLENGITAIEVTEFMTLSELAKIFDKRPAELVAKCMEMGMLASINHRLDMDTIETLALEFEVEVVEVEEVAAVALEEVEEINPVPRAPIVTIMGHVDHGKTTLLDFIRDSDIVAGEAGKITQHIGAYGVKVDKGTITFLDTPGHEAFSAMRARGAQVTDIIILVVSATESVMPQTVEAIDHSRAAGVPVIVAINKMDLPDANPESVRQQLSQHNLLSEEWGGKVIMVEVSAKSGEGVDKLLEMVLLQAEMMELKADPDVRANGAVIEARLERGRGTVSSLLVQRGTLRVGLPFVVGNFHGRVRAMHDDRGNAITEAGPSMAVQVTGISGIPLAGDSFVVTVDESSARDIAMKRQQIKREYDIRRVGTPTTLESIYEKIKDGQVTDLKIIVKGDVAGSVEALCETLNKIGNDEVRVNIIRSGVGAISESDVLLAAASDAIIVGFHVTADPRGRAMSDKENIDIRTYSVIYEIKEDITKAIEGLLKPEVIEKWVGSAEVREPFKVPKVGVICGSYVQQGRIRRGDPVRLSRDGIVLYEGRISSLRRFKDDIKEVASGMECGIGIEDYNDIKVGDLIESYELVETSRTL